MKSFLILALGLGAVQGHGGIYNYTIDGVDYAGHYPWLPEEGQVSVQRRWWPDPIYSEFHPYLACNRGNPLAKSLPTLHAPIKAGGKVQVSYGPPPCPVNPPVPFPTTPSVPGYDEPEKPMPCSGPEYQWIHHLGPLFGVYMADCQGPCDQWDGTGKRWFKIWEAGYNSTGHEGSYKQGEVMDIASSSRWWHADIIRQGWNVTIPNGLKSGHYLIRHEIINIESSLQIFPECAQLEVTGDGNDVAEEEYLTSFPGAYSAEEDAGIWMAKSGNTYSGDIGHKTFNFTMPGPKVWPKANLDEIPI